MGMTRAHLGTLKFLSFVNPFLGSFQLILANFQKQEFFGDKAPLLLPFYTNPMILFYLKFKNHVFLLLTSTNYLPSSKDTKKINYFF